MASPANTKAASVITAPTDLTQEDTLRLLRRVEEFLYREARCADENRYDDWFALWDEKDAHYWVPANADNMDSARHISIINERRHGIEERMIRLKSRAAYSQHPKSRMQRIVGNVTIESLSKDTVEVSAGIMIAELRSGRQDLFAGRQFVSLKAVGTDFKMTRKKVNLINNDDYIDNLSFIV